MSKTSDGVREQAQQPTAIKNIIETLGVETWLKRENAKVAQVSSLEGVPKQEQ